MSNVAKISKMNVTKAMNCGVAKLTILKVLSVLVASVLFAPVLFVPAVFASPIYVYRENDGTIRFTNKKPAETQKVEVFAGRTGSYARYTYSPIRYKSSYKLSPHVAVAKYESFIKRASKLNNVDANLIKAVIHAESAFNPRAISPKGAMGLMQLMPSTARMMGVKAFDPEDNVYGGSKLLAKLIKKYSGNLTHALAAYNAGEVAVEKYGGVPPYDETRTYVKRVLSLRSQYSMKG